MTILRVAWRNLWRNGRRTAITLTATALSGAMLIWVHALTDGMMVSALHNITQVAVGEVQIHAPGYLENRSLYRAIEEPQSVLRLARTHGIAATPRSYGFGLVSCEVKSAGAMFWGVEPGAEREAFELAGFVERSGDTAGNFLAAEPRRGMVLGRKLAKTLNARVGSEIVVVVQAADGSIGNDLFTVTGILQAVGDAIDRSAVIIHRQDFAQLFVTDAIHEIALNSKERLSLGQLVAAMTPAASGLDMKTWKELLPMFARMADMADVQMWIIGGIFFLAAGLGVMNTMLMATYERMREFGILKALGATPMRIVMDVAAEAFMLGMAASVFGLALGLAGAWLLQEVGIDTTRWTGTGVSIAGVTFDPVLRARITVSGLVQPVLMMWVTCVVAALYPAIRAARLDPVIAMTHV